MVVYYNLNRWQGKTLTVVREHFKNALNDKKSIMAHIKKNPCMPMMPKKVVSYYEVTDDKNELFYIDAEILYRGFINHLVHIPNVTAYGGRLIVRR